MASIWEFARRAIELRDMNKTKGAAKREEYVPTREAFQYACWFYSFDTPRQRVDAEQWVHLCIHAANEGRRGVGSDADPEDERLLLEDIQRRARANAKT